MKPKEEVSVSFPSETLESFVETSLMNSYCLWGQSMSAIFMPSFSKEFDFSKASAWTFVVVVGEALDPGDERVEEVVEDTGDAKTGNEILTSET